MLYKLFHHIGRWTRARTAQHEDMRSRRIVAVIECILNQNARDPGAATFPAMNESVMRLCAAHHVGMVQIPCPEKAYIGLFRDRPEGASIREVLDTRGGRDCCRQIAERLADQLIDYVANGYSVLAVLGGNSRSPGCAVIVDAGKLSHASGILMLELERVLSERRLNIPFRGIRDADSSLEREDLEWLEALLAGSLAA